MFQKLHSKKENSSSFPTKAPTKTSIEYEFPHEEYQIEPFFQTTISLAPFVVPSNHAKKPRNRKHINDDDYFHKNSSGTCYLEDKNERRENQIKSPDVQTSKFLPKNINDSEINKTHETKHVKFNFDSNESPRRSFNESKKPLIQSSNRLIEKYDISDEIYENELSSNTSIRKGAVLIPLPKDTKKKQHSKRGERKFSIKPKEKSHKKESLLHQKYRQKSVESISSQSRRKHFEFNDSD